jgi:tetratricopeptide (TPR) repeat protein
VALVRLGTEEAARPLGTAGRGALLVTALVLGAVAVDVQAGNRATADANDRLDRGDAVAALDAAARARRFRPWAAEPWELMGEAELALGRAQAARAHLRRALRGDPRSWSAWLSLGVASTGRERDAALARARSLNPLAPELEALAPAENP